MSLLICRILGHKWKYRDYSNAANHKGEKYNFTKVRICARCSKKEYKFDKWIDEKILPKEEIQ